MKKDASFLRVERQVMIAKQIAKNFTAGPVDYHKLVLWIKMNIGLTAEKASEYINDIAESHDWVIEDGKIKPE